MNDHLQPDFLDPYRYPIFVLTFHINVIIAAYFDLHLAQKVDAAPPYLISVLVSNFDACEVRILKSTSGQNPALLL